MSGDCPQREHALRAVFNGLRYIVRTGNWWRFNARQSVIVPFVGVRRGFGGLSHLRNDEIKGPSGIGEAEASRRRRHVAPFLGNCCETVCRQCLIPSIIRSLRLAFHLQLATAPSWEYLAVEHSLENSFAVNSSSSSHPSSFVRCRSQLNVCMCKGHLVSPLQVCFKLNAS